MSIMPLETTLTSSILIPAVNNSDMGDVWSIVREQDFIVICSL
jgi:hypothetical protein